jgi:hypothetical protein
MIARRSRKDPKLRGPVRVNNGASRTSVVGPLILRQQPFELACQTFGFVPKPAVRIESPARERVWFASNDPREPSVSPGAKA